MTSSPDASGPRARGGPALARSLARLFGSVRSQKIFCVGRNKTGTSSLTRAMAELGFRVGDQRRGEELIGDWGRRDFRRLVELCRSAQFFQDIPFSLPYTFQALDAAFPGSKFILTIRDAESWYRSMREFHLLESVHGEKARSLEQLKEATYRYKGFAYDTKVLVYDLPGEDPYDERTLVEHFHFHNRMVRDYFKNRPGDLLVLDVREEGAYARLCAFLGVAPRAEEFPWENRTI